MAEGRRRLFGFDVRSELDLRFPLPRAAGGGTELELLRGQEAPLEAARPAGTRLFESAFRTGSGDRFCVLDRSGEGDLLRFAGCADFLIRGRRLEVRAAAGSDPRLVELRLLGPVMSYWLELLGSLCLHASAVEVDGGAVAFLGAHRGGKTSLAAAFMRAGYALLTDDLLAVEEESQRARPSLPAMRMWPDLAAWAVGGGESLERVHPALIKRLVPVGGSGFGHFRDAARPLRAIYLPRRRDAAGGAAAEIRGLTRRDAVVELVARSFSPHLVDAAGLSARRLDGLARLARAVPVRRLDHAPGLDRLPEIRAAVVDDLAASAA